MSINLFEKAFLIISGSVIVLLASAGVSNAERPAISMECLESSQLEEMHWVDPINWEDPINWWDPIPQWDPNPWRDPINWGEGDPTSWVIQSLDN